MPKSAQPRLTKRTLEKVADAGLDSPRRADLAAAAGCSPWTFLRWLNKGKMAKLGSVYRRLSELVDLIDQYWVSETSEAVRLAGVAPFEEWSLEGTVLDEETGSPLKVKLTVRPPAPGVALRWLAAKCPDEWSEKRRLDLDAKVDADVRNHPDRTKRPVVVQLSSTMSEEDCAAAFARADEEAKLLDRAGR